MAYFDCIVGGSGKGNTVTVTCAEEFAGLTITLSKTGKTYTKTCPSTAPYVVTFNGVENGTYTVSTTVEGQTYAETVVVQDISCVLDYGFNWKVWIDTASQLDSSDYDTLDEVLADEKALRELFLEHACVDYMASVGVSNEDLETVINDDYCAKRINLSDYALDFLHANEVIADLMDEADKYFYGEWVITDDSTTPPTWGPKGNVPVMTSNTAPYGTASAYQVFDGNTSTTASGTDFSYKFVNPICPKDFYCNISGGTLQASNDGSTWSVPTSGSYYLYLRLHFASSVSPHTIQFYGRELKVSVPTMTSDTAPYGEAIGINNLSSKPYWYAFDSNATTYSTAQPSVKPFGVGYKFKEKTFIKKAVITIQNNYSKTFTHFVLQASNDGITWDDLTDEFTLSGATGTIKQFDFDGIEDYLMYRIYNSQDTMHVSQSYDFGFKELQFYGLDYSEKEFEVGTTKKWLYDHGLELEEMDRQLVNGNTYWADSVMIKQDSSIMVIAKNASNAAGGVSNKTAINLTSFNLLRGRVNNFSQKIGMWVFTSGSSTSSLAEVHYTSGNGNLPNNIGIDVSSINSDVFATIGVEGANSSGDFSELWLE